MSTDPTLDDEIKKMVQVASHKKSWLILVFHQVGDDEKSVVSDEKFFVSTAQVQRILNIVKNSGLPVILPTQALMIGHEGKPFAK